MVGHYNPPLMAFLRAVAYFFQEAAVSLWRSRLINAVSVGTIGISLFVFGAFLTVASNLTAVVQDWSRKVQVTFYLEDDLAANVRQSLVDRLEDDPGIESVAYVSRKEAVERFAELFPEMRSLPTDLGENPFPASVEATLRSGPDAPQEIERIVRTYGPSPGVEEAQYDLLWVQRLTTAIQLVRWIGGFLGGVLVLASVFTISNVVRLTAYARQDEIDIMRLVGATQAYIKGPFVMEGMLQGGLGGLLSVAALWVAFRVLVRDMVAASDLLNGAVVFLPVELILAIVAGGMLVGVAGSLLSLRRTPV
jgi:cell division transport system permease protein